MGRRFAALGFVLVSALYVASPVEGTERPGVPRGGARPGLARFEGGWIDVQAGSGPARVCVVVTDRPVECLRSAAEFNSREVPSSTPAVNCSSPLRLYDGLNRTGTLVSVYARGQWINLSTFGFDNKTSSYSVGACAAEMAAGSGGGGSHYSGCLDPWCVENSMGPGWNNVVSSVYLH